MSKFDNRVYMVICEISILSYKKTKFSTYFGYCSNMKICLKNFDMASSQVNDLLNIAYNLEQIFALDPKSITEYINTFFEDEKFRIFERIVLGMQLVTPQVFNLKMK